MPAVNPTRPLSRPGQQLAGLKARRAELTKRREHQGSAWPHAPAVPTSARPQTGAAPLDVRDSQDQSIP